MKAGRLSTLLFLFLITSNRLFAQQFSLQGNAMQTGPLTYTITPNLLTQVGMATNYYPVYLTQNFTQNFQLNFGTNDGNGADGMVFMLSNTCSPVLANGGGLGVTGVPNSLIAEFDTWDNGSPNNDISSDHTGIYGDGQLNPAGNIMDASTVPVCMLTTCGNVEDGQWYDISVQWEYLSATSQRLSVFVNGNLRATSTRNHIIERFAGNTIVFWSIAGSTGGSSNLQQFRLISGNNNQSYCVGQNFTLTAPSLGSNYSWTGSPSTTNTASYTATASGTISCSFIDYCGISRTVNFTVVVNPIPVATLNSPQACSGNTATLTASLDVPGTYSYVWTVPSGATNPGNTGSFGATVAGVYSVVATHISSGCVSNNASGTVTINPRPVATISNPAPVCQGQQAVITATPDVPGTYSYNWTVPPGATNPGDVNSFSAAVAGTYTVVVTNTATGCASDNTSVILTVNAAPTVTLNSPQPCDGVAAQLTATPGTPASYQYVWTVPAGATNPGNSAGFSTSVAGNYTVQITNVNTGCVSTSATGTVSFLPLPVASVNSANICAGTQAQIDATTSAAGSYSYSWTVPATVPNPGNVSTFSTGVAGVYSVIVTNTATGCNSVRSQGTVIVIPIEEPLFDAVPTICRGDILSPLPLLSLNSINGSWSPALNNTATTFYTFTPAAGQCADSASITIMVNNIPVISLGGDKEICPGQQIVLNPNATGFALQYHWQDGSSQPVYTATAVGDYSVSVSNQCGTASEDIIIEQGACKVYLPTGFTPNGDGLNDQFTITGQTYVKEFLLQVYNRWGQLVFASADATHGWDGMYKGMHQPPGVYIYKVRFTYLLTGEKYETGGTFALIR